MLNVCNYCTLFLLLLVPFNVYANISIGDIAMMLSPGTHAIKNVLHVTCIVLGVWLLIFALIQYRAHRQSPKHVPLDRSVTYGILGLLLVIIPIFGPSLLNSYNQVKPEHVEKVFKKKEHHHSHVVIDADDVYQKPLN